MLRVSIEPETAIYCVVYYAQGEDAAEALDLFDRYGPQDLLHRIAEYVTADSWISPVWSRTPPFGSADSCYWVNQDGDSGYVVSIHPGRLYVALTAWREP